jgi:dTDP-4-amino-4,6-dideoxygalactose transaminase
MATFFHNITTTLTTDLLTVGDNVSEIPKETSLVLGPEDNIAFNNGTSGYSMRIQVDDGSTTAVPVDVIIKRGT